MSYYIAAKADRAKRILHFLIAYKQAKKRENRKGVGSASNGCVGCLYASRALLL